MCVITRHADRPQKHQCHPKRRQLQRIGRHCKYRQRQHASNRPILPVPDSVISPTPQPQHKHDQSPDPLFKSDLQIFIERIFRTSRHLFLLVGCSPCCEILALLLFAGVTLATYDWQLGPEPEKLLFGGQLIVLWFLLRYFLTEAPCLKFFFLFILMLTGLAEAVWGM